jgi:ATP-dependent DNA helicase RecG
MSEGDIFRIIVQAPEFGTEGVESQPESQPESLNIRVLMILMKKPCGKAEISNTLGQKEISGSLNNSIRNLLANALIEMTIPEKPNSRLQKYRITEKGKTCVGNTEK